LYTLDVISQIVGIPRRLIATLVAPREVVAAVALYSLREVRIAFSSEAGVRLLRKLQQNQLELYRHCQVTWRDPFGVIHTAGDAVVERRGKRAEITLSNGYRFCQMLADPDFHFTGSRV
jgi:hypothetical protein